MKENENTEEINVDNLDWRILKNMIDTKLKMKPDVDPDIIKKRFVKYIEMVELEYCTKEEFQAFWFVDILKTIYGNDIVTWLEGIKQAHKNVKSANDHRE